VLWSELVHTGNNNVYYAFLGYVLQPKFFKVIEGQLGFFIYELRRFVVLFDSSLKLSVWEKWKYIWIFGMLYLVITGLDFTSIFQNLIGKDFKLVFTFFFNFTRFFWLIGFCPWLCVCFGSTFFLFFDFLGVFSQLLFIFCVMTCVIIKSKNLLFVILFAL
jgi:hypothetical protein